MVSGDLGVKQVRTSLPGWVSIYQLTHSLDFENRWTYNRLIMALSKEFTSGGYYIFPGGNPSTRKGVEEVLRGAGYIHTSPVEYVAGAILDDQVSVKLPRVERILQVFQSDLFAGAYQVWPPLSDHDKRDFVQQTFAGCSRQGDFFMVKERK